MICNSKAPTSGRPPCVHKRNVNFPEEILECFSVVMKGCGVVNEKAWYLCLVTALTVSKSRSIPKHKFAALNPQICQRITTLCYRSNLGTACTEFKLILTLWRNCLGKRSDSTRFLYAWVQIFLSLIVQLPIKKSICSAR